MIRVLLDQVGERLLVDLSDLRRDVVECGIAPKLLTRRRPAVLVGQGLLGVVALEGERRSRVAP